MDSRVGSLEKVNEPFPGESTATAEDDLDVESLKSENTLVEHLNLLRPNNPYRELDERRYVIRKQIKEKFKDAPKSVLDRAEDEKPPIEKRLEDTDKVLADLLSFGKEIITNIKVANEKRELIRREYEESQRHNLQHDIKKESIEALARYDDIVARWSELGNLKEPMVMFNKLEEQKQRIADLMHSKDEMIAQCQREIDRINERFQEDQLKHQADVCALVERIDGQIELLKQAYKHHLDLLQQTIESERQTIALKEQTKWNTFYETMQENEQSKLDLAVQKRKFYESEINRITAQQEEITRATRIRLEKDAELLEYELRNQRNQVLMNSEKLDYNYQVLQKRNEENVIINNQLKRRVAKLSGAISEIKKKIQSTQINADNIINKLTADIQKLHDSITDLEKKSETFRASNRKKFFSIWSINFEEIKELIEKVFNIDQILHEQQLGIPWKRPDVSLEELDVVAKEKGIGKRSFHDSALPHASKTSFGTMKAARASNLKKKEQNHSQIDLDKRTETRLLRNILRKIAERGVFLVEDRLLEFLEPYSEEQKKLVRIDNIFAALRITDIAAVNKLVEFFRPYAWCPNCMKGLPREHMKKLYATCEKIDDFDTNVYSDQEGSTDSIFGAESSAGSASKEELIKDDSKESPKECDNHCLIVESSMVLTALNEFTIHTRNLHDESAKAYNDKSKQKTAAEFERESTQLTRMSFSVQIDNETISDYWRKFLDYMPKEKEKLWHSLEHGMQHYLQVLKQREELDKECNRLRRQNAELKHLLQKFEI